jgi:hypothetical protein
LRIPAGRRGLYNPPLAGMAPTGAPQKWTQSMADHTRNSDNSKRGPDGSFRSTNGIPEATAMNNENRHVDITAMIRSLQRTEGQSDCFRRGISECGEIKCTWRQYCVSKNLDDR